MDDARSTNQTAFDFVDELLGILAESLLDPNTDDDKADDVLRTLTKLSASSPVEVVATYRLIQKLIEIHLDQFIEQRVKQVTLLGASVEIFSQLQTMRNLVASFAVGKVKPSEEIVLQAIGDSAAAIEKFNAVVAKA